MRYFSRDVEESESIYASGDDSLSPASRKSVLLSSIALKNSQTALMGSEVNSQHFHRSGSSLSLRYYPGVRHRSALTRPT